MDIHFSHEPMAIGETRPLTITGHGPFNVRAYATPRGPEAQPRCVAEIHGLAPERVIEITADNKVWQGRCGVLELDVVDGDGSKRKVHVNVRPRDPLICDRMLICA